MLALVAFVAVAVAIGLLVIRPGGSGANNGTGGATATGGAATVQRRDLVATDTESGTLGYAESADGL